MQVCVDRRENTDDPAVNRRRNKQVAAFSPCRRRTMSSSSLDTVPCSELHVLPWRGSSDGSGATLFDARKRQYVTQPSWSSLISLWAACTADAIASPDCTVSAEIFKETFKQDETGDGTDRRTCVYQMQQYFARRPRIWTVQYHQQPLLQPTTISFQFSVLQTCPASTNNCV